MMVIKDLFVNAWVTGLCLLGVMTLGQRAWECIRPAHRNRRGWISQASDVLINAEYFVALVLSVTMYAGFFHYVILRPTEFSVAMVIPSGLTVCTLAATWFASAKPALRLWKETNGLPLKDRGLWASGAFFFPMSVPGILDERKRLKGTLFL
jgi:hypothetical protein